MLFISQRLVRAGVHTGSALDAAIFVYSGRFKPILRQGIHRTEADTGTGMVLRASLLDNDRHQFSS